MGRVGRGVGRVKEQKKKNAKEKGKKNQRGLTPATPLVRTCPSLLSLWSGRALQGRTCGRGCDRVVPFSPVALGGAARGHVARLCSCVFVPSRGVRSRHSCKSMVS